MVDVGRDDGAAACDFVADEFGRHIVGDGRAEALAVADIFGEAGTAEILALRDIFHLGRDDTATGIVHLADVAARPGAQRALDDVRKGLHAAGAIRSLEAVILGLHGAGVIGFHIAAADDPVAAQGGEAGHDVDAGVGIGIGAGRVIDADRRLAAGGFEVDLPHRDLQGADMDFARSPDRACSDAHFGACGDICHDNSPSGGKRVRAVSRRAPSLRRCQPDQVQRVAAPPLVQGSQPPLNRLWTVPRGWQRV